LLTPADANALAWLGCNLVRGFPAPHRQNLVRRSKSDALEIITMFLTSLLISAGKAFAERRSRERAYNELMALSDHALADIGIERSQVRSLVYDESTPARAVAAKPAQRPGIVRHWPA
jgi:uncharacterized protein YjiS (DUF1127 family)